jgi:hypothetical protein
VGCPGKSVKEQELSDLTASILATFPKMSNMFLHFRQVIDSRLQNEASRATKLWKYRTIRSIKLLNKWMSLRVLLVEANKQIAPLLSSIPQAGLYFRILIN